MKLTIKQSLEKAIVAHKEGKLRDAEILYRDILKSQPLHPDANHNLGLLLLSVDKVNLALPVFKTALEANPRLEQFWLSYIVALIKEKQFENAKQVFKQAKKLKMEGDKLNALEVKLASMNEINDSQINQPLAQINTLSEHYQNGRFRDAEKLAIHITQEFPTNQFAWKILGALLKQTGRIKESLKACQKSVQLMPRDPEAHNNLGNTLQELGRLKEAEASYLQAIALKPSFAEAHNNFGVIQKELGKLKEAEASYLQAIALKPDYAEAHNNLGNALQGLGKLKEAEASYLQAIALKPDYAEVHFNSANKFKDLGKLKEAEASYSQAIALKPNFAEAYNNLGVILIELGKLKEAEANYLQAIALKPDYAEAHNNLGNALQRLGRLKESESSYSKAIALKPDYSIAYINLGNTLQELGRIDDSCSVYIQAINLNPNYTEAYINLSLIIRDFNFTSSDPQLYRILMNMLKIENAIRPQDIAISIIRLLYHDPIIKGLLAQKNIDMSLKVFNSNIDGLNKVPILHNLMRLCPLPDLQFEGIFVRMRSFLLTNLDKIETSPELTYFLSTLCLHCFTNEYVYFVSNEESQLVDELEAEISQTIMQSERTEAIKIMCLASYRPLHQYDWCEKIEELDYLEEVKRRLIKEPLSERSIAKNISVLGEITDDISCKVRTQYEESPYPRWVKLAIPPKTKSVAVICDEVKLDLHSESIRDITSPRLLIAGCGTGQHPIETACRFSDCQVTAIDLSLASLAYAKRKTSEFGITNLEYLQADILKLYQLEQDFDIIESAGVLHHMNEPMAGWRALTDLLKPGGLMKIGLYSELARQNIVEIREKISLNKLGTSLDQIKEFRLLLAESHNENYQLLTKSNDFFSLSMLRDLIFHVQEHRFTLIQIKNCLEELGLKFCGFENKDAISKFTEFQGEKAKIYDLEMWHEFEESNTNTFAGMYQFWCQKL